MADPRPCPTGEIIDHPAFKNYETLQRLSEPFTGILAAEPELTAPMLWEQLLTGYDVFENVPNDRFLVHEPDLVSEDGPDEDPLEIQDGYVSDESSESDFEIDEMLQIRREHHRSDLIAAGFRPERRVRSYTISPDLFANTSLEVPELLSASDSGPPQCRAQRAEDLTIEGLSSGAFEELVEEARSERERVHELELDSEGCERRLAAQKDMIPALKDKLQTFADEWCKKDPEAYSKWQRHVVRAHYASDSSCRVFQIALFYIKSDVPDKLWDALRDLAQRELLVSAYDLDYKRALAGLGDIDEDACYCSDHVLPNDFYWNQAAQKKTGEALFFGDDYEYDLPNGFGDYLAQGREGMTLAQHITANIETRRIRVEHSVNLDEKDEDFESDQATTTALRAKFLNFTVNAQKAVYVELYKLLGDDDVPSNPGPEKMADVQALKDVEKALADARAEVGRPHDDGLPDIDL